jgi:hypothetical protein
MTPAGAKMLAAEMRRMVCAEAAHVIPTETTHVTSVKTTDMATAKTTGMTSAKTTAATGLRAGGKQAPGKHRACQNHHHSSSHDILHWIGRTFRHSSVRRRRVCAIKHQRRDGLEMAMLVGGLH